MPDKVMNLLPCPFCGESSDSYLEIEEVSRVEKRLYNKAGISKKRIDIQHHVLCNNCGATGGTSVFNDHEEDILTSVMINNSKQGAVLAWNARFPVNKKAFELVNDIIIKSFQVQLN